VGFFKRRAEERREADQKVQLFEAAAQLAASDMAVGVLMVCRKGQENPRLLLSFLPMLLSDGAPSFAVRGGLQRAAELDDEIRRTFGDTNYSVAQATLLAAWDDDFEDEAKPELYGQLSTLAGFSDEERRFITAYSDALNKEGVQFEPFMPGPSGCATDIHSSDPRMTARGHPYVITVMGPTIGPLPIFVGSRDLDAARDMARRIREEGYEAAANAMNG
jgi:hypothetical protein